MTEFRTKAGEVISEQIGPREKEMIYVSLVFTAPESQGHGYASALVGTITRLVRLFTT
jgi:predicted GNAT family acetyltransferase